MAKRKKKTKVIIRDSVRATYHDVLESAGLVMCSYMYKTYTSFFRKKHNLWGNLLTNGVINNGKFDDEISNILHAFARIMILCDKKQRDIAANHVDELITMTFTAEFQKNWIVNKPCKKALEAAQSRFNSVYVPSSVDELELLQRANLLDCEKNKQTGFLRTIFMPIRSFEGLKEVLADKWAYIKFSKLTHVMLPLLDEEAFTMLIAANKNEIDNVDNRARKINGTFKAPWTRQKKTMEFKFMTCPTAIWHPELNEMLESEKNQKMKDRKLHTGETRAVNVLAHSPKTMSFTAYSISLFEEPNAGSGFIIK